MNQVWDGTFVEEFHDLLYVLTLDCLHQLMVQFHHVLYLLVVFRVSSSGLGPLPRLWRLGLNPLLSMVEN